MDGDDYLSANGGDNFHYGGPGEDTVQEHKNVYTCEILLGRAPGSIWDSCYAWFVISLGGGLRMAGGLLWSCREGQPDGP